MRYHHALIVAAALLTTGSAVAADPPKDIGHLWQITRTGIPDSYVFGTIHVADPRVAALPAPVRGALAKSRTLAVEMVPEWADSGVAELELLGPGESLAQMLRPDVYARLRTELAAQGQPAAVIDRLKPWAAMMKLGRKVTGAATGSNLDTQLLQAARDLRLKILPLEMIEEQISAFDSIPLASQVALLEHVLLHRDALAATVEPTIVAWQRGDFRALGPIAGVAYDPYPGMGEHRVQLMKNIIDNRTVLMHHRLASPLREGRVFVAVGAMHLPGQRGLLALLRAEGCVVTALW